MAAQETENVLAQRLASNERSIRTTALKTLRKYIKLRSQKVEGGFTSDDLLKIWKGLFYCLWMQDKPLLQEELSDRISGLIHSFHNIDNQLLYFETFLQTVKREWNGIDKLRMDKFFQLVRFVFRQVFELIKRNKWESSVIKRFLDLFTAQLLQNSERVPAGLILHILELYMTELAQVGASELTAEQNFTFIDPFCQTMAKTKNSSLMTSISKNIFTVIVEQAPFAVEDLLKELHHPGEDSDSGQASEEEESAEKEELKGKALKKAKGKRKKVNGIPEHEDDEDDFLNVDDDDHDDDDLEDLSDDEMGPVLQFDYGAIADRLFELGSRSNTPNFNRAKMYRLVKMYRDLSEGLFPQDEDMLKDNEDEDEDVDEDEDEEREKKHSNKKKRKKQTSLAEDESPAKKQKVTDGSDAQSRTTENVNKKKKKKKGKVKPKKLQTETSQTSAEPSVEAGDTTAKQNNEEPSGDVSRVNTSSVSLETQSQSESQKSGSQSESEAGGRKKKRKNKKRKSNLMKVEEEVAADQHILEDNDKEHLTDPDGEVIECPSTETLEVMESGAQQAKAPPSGRKKKGKKNQGEEPSLNVLPLEILSAPTPAKKKKKEKEAPAEDGETSTTKTDSDVKALEEPSLSMVVEASSAEEQPKGAVSKKKKKQKVQKTVEDKTDDPPQENSADDQKVDEGVVASTIKRKNKNKKQAVKSNNQVDVKITESEIVNDKLTSVADTTELSLPKPGKKKKTKQASSEVKEPEAQPDCVTEPQIVEESSCTPTPLKKKKKHKKLKLQTGDSTIEMSEESKPAEEPVLKKNKTEPKAEAEASSSLTLTKKGKQKRRMQTEEAETAQINGHTAEKDPEISVAVTSKKKRKVKKASPKSDFVSFQDQAKAPSPLFCKVKPKSSPSTPLSSLKTFQTPKSETKKVTFGLKNNKTAEFRKTDRSLLLSPVGSSRVAFDPKKKPVSGVLKSPSSSPAVSVKKPAPKRRATAADFF